MGALCSRPFGRGAHQCSVVVPFVPAEKLDAVEAEPSLPRHSAKSEKVVSFEGDAPRNLAQGTTLLEDVDRLQALSGNLMQDRSLASQVIRGSSLVLSHGVGVEKQSQQVVEETTAENETQEPVEEENVVGHDESYEERVVQVVQKDEAIDVKDQDEGEVKDRDEEEVVLVEQVGHENKAEEEGIVVDKVGEVAVVVNHDKEEVEQQAMEKEEHQEQTLYHEKLEHPDEAVRREQDDDVEEEEQDDNKQPSRQDSLALPESILDDPASESSPKRGEAAPRHTDREYETLSAAAAAPAVKEENVQNDANNQQTSNAGARVINNKDSISQVIENSIIDDVIRIATTTTNGLVTEEVVVGEKLEGQATTSGAVAGIAIASSAEPEDLQVSSAIVEDSHQHHQVQPEVDEKTVVAAALSAIYKAATRGGFLQPVSVGQEENKGLAQLTAENQVLPIHQPQEDCLEKLESDEIAPSAAPLISELPMPDDAIFVRSTSCSGADNEIDVEQNFRTLPECSIELPQTEDYVRQMLRRFDQPNEATSVLSRCYDAAILQLPNQIADEEMGEQ
ncbi:unnamed protein product [Amoebophrya sp. A25]|nr:unnamed protein product [Amoebophrya sp. A25]|eukprot:GSA25T00020723001.1